MIEQYVASSRRTRAPTAEMTKEYNKYFERILAITAPSDIAPELHITYSSDRRCELIRIDKSVYLIYDQYLGQSFNRLNRIQYARHGAEMLSQAYASKYVAERLLCLGQTGPAAFFALMAQQFEKNVKGDSNPLEPAKNIDEIRVGLTLAQELFIMSHELAHHRWQLDRDNLTHEITHYINEFLDKGKDSKDSTSISGYYKETLDKAPVGFLEEVFADDFGALIALHVASSAKVPVWQSAAGVVLAFKYMRFFRHLDLLARHVADLSSETDPQSFKNKIATLSNEIWDGVTLNIRRFQFREHFIRHRLEIACSRLPSYNAGDMGKMNSLICEYEDNTENPVVLGLVKRLSETLTLDIWTSLRENMESRPDGIDIVDKMTGWSR